MWDKVDYEKYDKQGSQSKSVSFFFNRILILRCLLGARFKKKYFVKLLTEKKTIYIENPGS